jgi:hypothetical protein
MNKTLGGCLAVALVAVVGGAIAGWFIVVKPLWQAGSELVESGKQWAQVAEMDASVSNAAPYTPPAQDRLDGDAVARFIAVQLAIEQALGGNWQALEQKYEALDQRVKAEGRNPTMSELFGAYNDLSGIILAAKRAQVDALNAQGMSLAEYRYLRMQGYMAAGLALQDETPQQLEGSAAAHNAALLRPHRELLQRTLSTAWLGF